MTDTCNFCDEELTLPDDIDVISVVCPHCGNVTGVCANCRWHDILMDCDACPFKVQLREAKEDGE